MIMKSKPQFFLLALIFFLPMFSGWFLYHYHGYFQLKTTNRGTLINPPINGQSWMQSGEKKWKIMYVEKIACDDSCHSHENAMLQVQKALGKDSDRVLVSFLPQQASLQADTIYLMDPIGNIFMYYPDATDPMNVLKDMKHILEVSQIG